MNTKEMIADTVSDFLESNHPSHWIRWIMVLFLLFCSIPQKTVASVTKFDYFRECNALKEYCDKINQSNLEISEAF